MCDTHLHYCLPLIKSPLNGQPLSVVNLYYYFEIIILTLHYQHGIPKEKKLLKQCPLSLKSHRQKLEPYPQKSNKKYAQGKSKSHCKKEDFFYNEVDYDALITFVSKMDLYIFPIIIHPCYHSSRGSSTNNKNEYNISEGIIVLRLAS